MSWVPLHLHSQYSILQSTASVEDFVDRSAALSIPALALTDSCNLFGAIAFFKASVARGIKPIIGCEMIVAPHTRYEKKKVDDLQTGNRRVGYPLTLLARNRKGYENLCKVVSIGYLEGFYYTPRVDREVLERYAEGLFCLSGSLGSRLAQSILEKKEGELREELSWCRALYGEYFYFELQRHRMDDAAIREGGIDREPWLYQHYLDHIQKEERVVERLLALSADMEIPCVATNDTHYLDRRDWKAHEILMNVQSGEPCEILKWGSDGRMKGRSPNPKRRVLATHEHFFKSPREMEELFSDAPRALENSLRIADACNLTLDFDAKFYPLFTPPHLEGKRVEEEARLKEVASYLRRLSHEGLSKRYTAQRLERVRDNYPGRDPQEVVRERMEKELDIIIAEGMCDYFLIVYDFISWAKGRGIPVGPGRGSGAGSLVLYLIGVTEIEPLRFNLFFERFINPKRISYPDIDIDICMDRRSEVIEYTIEKYGRDKVAQIITFGKMKAKMAIRDVGRVLGMPVAKVNDIAKLIPEDPNMTIERALEVDETFRVLVREDEEVARVVGYARMLEGSIRNSGVHAAGLIICRDPLTDHIPVCSAKDSAIQVTQYSMKPVESLGMLKIDFLGLKTLTSIDKTVRAIRVSTGQTLDWTDLPLEDSATFSLLNRGKTSGVFQLESSGMQALVEQLHIDRFEEIIAVGALYRPGPMKMIPSFIARKHGREAIEVDHPLMEDIIRETYGIIVYQEQVIQIASRLAGYSFAEGDVLRYAMGKKDRGEMAKQREKFCRGALAQGIEEKRGMEIFDKIEKFASYGFNKSHATAYGYLSYVTAYFKANYPREWFSALMSCDADDLTKISKHIREAEAMGIAILPPDIDESEVGFTPTPAGIRFAMSAIKGVGRGAVETICSERRRGGPFSSLYDFFLRVGTGKIGKKVAENLIGAGSFDRTGWTRQALLDSVEPIFRQAVREQRDRDRGVMDLFAKTEGEDTPFQTPPEVEESPVQRRKLLAKERELLGFYLTGHPLDEYRELLDRLGCSPLRSLSPSRAICKVAFIIEAVKVRISATSQKKFAILTIGDGLEHLELLIWPALYLEKSPLLLENRTACAILQIGRGERFVCRDIQALDALDGEKIEAFEKRFSQMQKRSDRGDFEQKDDGKKKERGGREVLSLTLDAGCTRLSQIVALKRLFRDFPGNCSVSLHFRTEEREVASIEVGSQWHIAWSAHFEERLRELPCITALSLKKEGTQSAEAP